ncbi:hypothetical protein BvRS1_39720 [Burkholderia vietnamiensis]|nr:hypothetical protein BvRS1_39720 [Burkholderia vietnamiensis]
MRRCASACGAKKPPKPSAPPKSAGTTAAIDTFWPASGDGAPGPWMSAIGVVLPPQFALTGAAVAATTGAASAGSSRSGANRRSVGRRTGNPVGSVPKA